MRHDLEKEITDGNVLEGGREIIPLSWTGQAVTTESFWSSPDNSGYDRLTIFISYSASMLII